MAGKAGASGRPPRPLEQQRKLGIVRQDRIPSTSQTVALESAEGAPVPVALSSRGRDLWTTFTETFWISKLDLMLVEQACMLADDIDNLRGEIGTEWVVEEPLVTPAGIIVEGATKKAAHPLIKELRVAQKLLLDFAVQLGFSPSARARLGIAEIKKVRDKLAELKHEFESRSPEPAGSEAG
jgi:hypothetical protein